MSHFSFGHFRGMDAGSSHAANDARAEARSATSEVQMLRAEVDRLYMISEALWTLLRDQAGYDDQTLAEAVRQVDLKDGKLDGRAGATEGPKMCGSCGKAVSKKRPLCMYCGTPVEGTLFDR